MCKSEIVVHFDLLQVRIVGIAPLLDRCGMLAHLHCRLLQKSKLMSEGRGTAGESAAETKVMMNCDTVAWCLIKDLSFLNWAPSQDGRRPCAQLHLRSAIQLQQKHMCSSCTRDRKSGGGVPDQMPAIMSETSRFGSMAYLEILGTN